MFNEYNNLLTLENTDNDVYVINNLAVQPTAFSTPCIIYKEPGLFGKTNYFPFATNSYAYHPNNNAHLCWGYQLYSWTNYICNKIN